MTTAEASGVTETPPTDVRPVVTPVPTFRIDENAIRADDEGRCRVGALLTHAVHRPVVAIVGADALALYEDGRVEHAVIEDVRDNGRGNSRVTLRLRGAGVER